MIRNLLFLSNKSIKANKKYFSHLMIGFVISSIILLVFGFFLASFEYGMYKAVNNNETSTAIFIETSEKNEVDSIIDYLNVKDYEKIKFTEYSYNYGRFRDETNNIYISKPTITIGNHEYKDFVYSINDYRALYETFVEFEGDFNTSAEKNFMKKKYDSKVIIAGEIPTSSNEVVIASDFLDAKGIKYEDVIGKSLIYSNRFTIDNKEQDYPLVENVVISGVYDYRLFNSTSRSTIEHRPLLIFKDIPTTIKEVKNVSVLHQASVQLNSFEITEKTYNLVKANDFNEIKNKVRFDDLIYDYREMRPMYELVGTILIFCSSVLVIVSLLNSLICYKQYYKKKKKYLSMCNALGMNNKDKAIYCFIQNFILFVKPIIIIFGISLISCIGLKLWFDNIKIDSYNNEIIKYQLEFSMYPVVFAIFIGIQFIWIILVTLIILFEHRKDSIIY